MPNDNDETAARRLMQALETNHPTEAELFAAALAYLDRRIAWLQQERRDLVELEAQRMRERAEQGD